MRTQPLSHPARAVALALLGGMLGCTTHIIVGEDPTTAAEGSAAMVRVPVSADQSFLIDTTKVTQAQYDRFLKSNPVPDPTSPGCEWKTSIELQSSCFLLDTDSAAVFDPVGHADYPMVCVDMCDAAAYCSWAGKHLCGRVGGGTMTGEDMNTSKDEWYLACTNGGLASNTLDRYPYDGPYDPDKCREYPAPSGPVKSKPECHGVGAPYDSVYDMIDSVGELTDFCEFDGMCFTRGVTYPNGTSTGPACASSSGETKHIGAAPRTGFRCCAD